MKLKSSVAALFLAALASCNESALTNAPPPDAGDLVGGLTPDQAARVVAKVGDRTITLGDYARALDRMDQFDRLRYQTKERRRELLNDMVDVELLANEAKRRGLDKEPEVEDQIRQILRDAMLAQAREGLPAPANIPADEVRAYYEANQDKFDEPERRRVAVIVMTDKKEAEKVLKLAEKAKTGTAWGELWAKHSSNAPKDAKAPASPVDLAGDLGIVGPLNDAKGSNPKVPDPVRAAVFKLGTIGDVLPDLVEVEGKQFIVRMNGITASHHRTLAEADRTIRVLIIQEKMAAREAEVEAELRKKFPVTIDEKALAGVKLPAGADKVDVTGPSPLPMRENDMPAADAGAPPPRSP